MVCSLQAQEFEVGLKAGAALFQGDVIENTFDFEEINYGVGLFARYHFDHNFAFRASVNFGQYSGNDANNPSLADRGLSFESTIVDFQVTGEWNFLGVNIYEAASQHNARFTPYALLGVGVTAFDVEVFESPDGAQLDPLDVQREYPGFSMVVPVGLGVRYSLDRLVVGIEGVVNAGLNDYLDGISRSGDQSDNDWYTTLSLTVAYRIGATAKTGGAQKEMMEDEEIFEEGDIIIEEEY